MKRLLLIYVLASLVLFALFAVLSYGYGNGYVYIYWRDWQFQSGVLGLIGLFILVSLLAQFAWLFGKRSFAREQRKKETILHFKDLHPYEQLGIVWLLEAAKDQQVFIERVYTQSGLLNHIIDAQFDYKNGDYETALQSLEKSAPMAFELAELQRIDIYLEQQETQKALTHLEFLAQHQLSPWLTEIETAYQQRITALWGKLALQEPWLFLQTTQYGLLDAEHRDLWLQQLLIRFDQASVDDLAALQQRYLVLQDEIQTRPYSSKVLWLKLLARMPEMSLQHEDLALHLLQDQFDPEVFYLWFQQQLLKQIPDYAYVEQRIIQLEQRYTSVPMLSFAKWHIYVSTQRQQDAEQLLTLYPDNILMSYLRIKATLGDNSDLIRQLNLIFENDVNFLNFKI
ncbi:heme biosynthesis protein HemY [Acinetobacter sp. C26M]|uniref:heme biosynthesis protein HemY n=1 Tax=unclassified Acinetobacter TaxID=196816 RepID=UPI00141EA6E1|nr:MULTISPECIES: heme biosynthesis protein HemY [unclassified Acinetobacter]NIE97606.1 heme biosynthesis protein HemY [Acinetobacter sp. Tr-809]USA46308.1 heme biosynthesis protein HemY [Acinetobacter sp. C26M]USA49792.1 heme biosynthesis protein HemY [Acinetobacter sp. C26G]